MSRLIDLTIGSNQCWQVNLEKNKGVWGGVVGMGMVGQKERKGEKERRERKEGEGEKTDLKPITPSTKALFGCSYVPLSVFF